MSVLRPQVAWAERKDTAFITVDLQNTSDLNIDLEETGLKFHAVSDGNTYEFELTFPDKVDKEKSKFSSTRLIHILLHKQEAKRWRKLTTQPGKLHWLKCDWNKWIDTDEEDQPGKTEGYGDMDFSQFGNMMGGGLDDPGMFGDDDEDDSEGLGEGGLDDLDDLDAPTGDEDAEKVENEKTTTAMEKETTSEKETDHAETKQN